MIAKLALLALCCLSAAALFDSKRTKVYCALYQTAAECNKVPACTYATLDLANLFRTQAPFGLCLDKEYFVRSLKVALYPSSYSSTSDATLAQDAGVSGTPDLTDVKNINAVVQGLIANKKVKYITSFAPAAAA